VSLSLTFFELKLQILGTEEWSFTDTSTYVRCVYVTYNSSHVKLLFIQHYNFSNRNIL